MEVYIAGNAERIPYTWWRKGAKLGVCAAAHESLVLSAGDVTFPSCSEVINRLSAPLSRSETHTQSKARSLISPRHLISANNQFNCGEIYSYRQLQNGYTRIKISSEFFDPHFGTFSR